MKRNRGIVYAGSNSVELRDIPYPKLEFPNSKAPAPHGVVLKVLLSCICGSDLHMVHGRTNALPGSLVLGHEITGEVIECGPDVEQIKVGDIVSVPFNISCGRCSNCKALMTQICLNVNPMMPGGAYGYVNMGGWQGGQAEYVMVPYADWNLLKLPPLHKIRDKLLDIALLTDVFPTGFHGAFEANVGVGTTVYIAGAGPVGLCAAEASRLLGASKIIVGDSREHRLALARKIGCDTVNIEQPLQPQIQAILDGEKYVDCAIDCVGYEAHGCTHESEPSAAFNQVLEVIRHGGTAGVPGLYISMDPKAPSQNEKRGIHKLLLGQAWEKGISIRAVGQAPVMRYNQQLLSAIMNGRSKLAELLNVTVISLEEAPKAYELFTQGAANKFVIDPHNFLGMRASQTIST